MRIRIAAFAVAGLATLGVYAQAIKNASEGVYTKAQADAGRKAYLNKCATCHGDLLTGGEMAPPLTGGDFSSLWAGLTVYDFFDRVRKTMPVGSEGTVGREECAQITAFILSQNGYPAGSAALDTHDEVLQTIKLDTKQ